MEFRELTIEDKALFDEYIGCEYENCEAVFANLFVWRNISNTRFALIDDALCVIYTKGDGRMAACIPMGKNFDFKGVVKKLCDYFNKNGQKPLFESVPQNGLDKFIGHFQNEIEYFSDCDLADYVYSTEALINLRGKKLHAKRNHINKFLSLYQNFEYKELNSSMFDLCLENVEKWLLQKYSPTDKDFKNELTVIKECFSNYEKLNLSGGALFVDGKIAAFTIGERYFNNSCVVHIEKADVNVEGAYTMINNLYIKNAHSETEFVNREEDMGIEGIRKAKLSYRPHHMVEKYTINFK